MALDWFASYLKDRKASVKIESSISSPLEINIGVPQGSILGPLLFILYTKELESIARNYGLMVELYADDTQLYVSFCNDALPDLETKLQGCLNHIKTWMSENFLRLNPSKTEIIVLNNKHDKTTNPESLQTMSGQEPTKPVTLVRNLGVFLDSELSLSGHVTRTVRTCQLALMNLWKIQRMLGVNLKIKLVNSLIHSRIDYCNSLLAGSSAKDIGRLQKIQNSAARFVAGQRRFQGTTNLRKQFHFLPVRERVQYKLCLLTYKALNGIAPSSLSNLIKLRKPKTKCLRRDADKTFLDKNYSRYCSSKGAFSVSAPLLWNALPISLRESSSVSSFKSSLKTHLSTYGQKGGGPQ